MVAPITIAKSPQQLEHPVSPSPWASNRLKKKGEHDYAKMQECRRITGNISLVINSCAGSTTRNISLLTTGVKIRKLIGDDGGGDKGSNDSGKST